MTLPGIGARQIDLHPAEIGREFLPRDARFRTQILVLIVDQKRVVRFRPGPVIRPALPAEVTGKIVIVGAQIGGPPDTAGIEHETSQIEMRVRGLVVAALHRQVKRVRVVPRAAETRDIDAAEDGIQRPGRSLLLRRLRRSASNHARS